MDEHDTDHLAEAMAAALDDETRRRLLGLADDLGAHAARLERRLSRSSLVFGAGHAADAIAPAGSPIDGATGPGDAISAAVSMVERTHQVPSDVLDTFTSLGQTVVSSMTTAVTTSIGDGVSVGEGAAERVLSIDL